jgi:hypothetical protein
MRYLLVVLVLATAVPGSGSAQAGIAPPASVPADTIHHGPAPLGYFFRSLLIPGWGQASLDRKLTGGLFIAFEGLAISMAMKTSTELRYLDQTDSVTAVARRAEQQDWIVLIVFNHLFSALEAYVSAHLIDFPRDLHLRVLPGSRPGVGVMIPIGH